MERKLHGEDVDAGGQSNPAKRARSSGNGAPGELPHTCLLNSTAHSCRPLISPGAQGSNGRHVVLDVRKCHGGAVDGVNGAQRHPHLLSSGTLGMHGFCFLDLGSCTFRQTEKKSVAATDPEEAAAPATREAEAVAEAPKVQTMRVLYPSLSMSTGVDWGSLTKRLKRILSKLCEYPPKQLPPVGEMAVVCALPIVVVPAHYAGLCCRVPRFYCALQLLVDHPDAQACMAAQLGNWR